MPVSKASIAGAAALTREPINIADVYDLDERAPYGFDRSFDEKHRLPHADRCSACR